jgi:hypothetical protein
MKIKRIIFVAISLILFGMSSIIGISTLVSDKEEGITLSALSVVSQNHSLDLVIIAPEKFSLDLQPLINHKNSHGVQTTLKTTEDIYQEYEGRDNAEQVKYYIKDAIEESGIRYVLLVGGRQGQLSKWHVPIRYSHIDDGLGYSHFISDLYFADVYKNGNQFEDWDSNGNGIFSEWMGITKDELDLIPDVSIGRLPCRNTFEVKIMVKKIINYENRSFDHSWFNTVVIVGGNTFPQTDDNPFPYEGEATGDIAASYMGEFDIIKLYTSTGTFTNHNDIITAFNSGCGFFFTRGRGGTDRIRMVTPEGNEFIALHNIHIPKLRNVDMYPVCVLGECIHGKFDVSLLTFFEEFTQQNCIPECIAWRLVRKMNGGGIATITNTNLCYGTPGDNNNNDIPDDAEQYGGWLAVECFRLYGQEKQTILGDIYQTSITNYIQRFPVKDSRTECKSVQEFILIGDPSLKIGGYH